MIRRCLAALMAMVALAGCRVDVDVRVDIEPGGSGTVTVHAVADEAVVSAAPGLAADLRFDDAIAAGWQVVGPQPHDGGLEVTLTHPFATTAEATALLASLNGSGGPLRDVVVAATDDGLHVAVTGSLRIDGALNAFADPEVLAAVGGSPFADDIAASSLRPADAVGVTFSVEFPGPIESTTGKRSGRTATWNVPLDGTPLDIASRSGVERADSGWTWTANVALAALGVWLVIAGSFVGWVLWQRRVRSRRRRATTAGAPQRTP